MATSHIARRSRKWNGLSNSELQRVRDLSQANLHSASRGADDYRLWFEASRRLDDFDIETALSQLRLWSQRFPSWLPFYYTYILEFLVWLDDSTTSADRMLAALQSCPQYALGAWLVRRGSTERKPDPETVSSLVNSVTEENAIDEPKQRQELVNLKTRRVLGFINDIVHARAALNAPLTLTDLHSQAEAVYGLGLGIEQFKEKFLENYQFDRVEPTGAAVLRLPAYESSRTEHATSKSYGVVAKLGGSYVFLDDGTGERVYLSLKSLANDKTVKLHLVGQVVEFTPGRNSQGKTAVGVRLLDPTVSLGPSGPVELHDLAREVSARALDLIEAAATQSAFPLFWIS